MRSYPSLSAKRLQSDCKMVVTEAFKTRGNRCRTWSYNDFSLYAVYRPDGLPLGSNSHQSETIATARSNKVAVCLGFQDFSQLTRDYGYKEGKVIQNTVGNVFSSQVVGAPPKTLSERFGKVLQQRQSITINRNDKSTSISTQLDSLIPASKISNLTQGMFVGAVSDNFDERIEQKIFHAEIVVDIAKATAEARAYQPIPVIAEFLNEDGSDNLSETIEANYKCVKQEILSLVETKEQNEFSKSIR